MRCEYCGNGERRPERRARVAGKNGRRALVLGVPVEVCTTCNEVWLPMEVAERLDAMFNDMLADDLEFATRHWDTPQPHGRSSG